MLALVVMDAVSLLSIFYTHFLISRADDNGKDKVLIKVSTFEAGFIILGEIYRYIFKILFPFFAITYLASVKFGFSAWVVLTKYKYNIILNIG